MNPKRPEGNPEAKPESGDSPRQGPTKDPNIGGPLTAEARRQQDLRLLLPRLGPNERQIIIRLEGIAGRPKESVDEINQDLFGGTPMGSQKIIGLKQSVDREINALPQREPEPLTWKTRRIRRR